MRPIGSLLTLTAAVSLAMAQAKPVSLPMIPAPGANTVVVSGAARRGTSVSAREPAAKPAAARPAEALRSGKHYKPMAPKSSTRGAGQPSRAAARTEQAKGQPELVTEVAIQRSPGHTMDDASLNKGRDPFVSIIREESDKHTCSTGKKCLVVGDLTLRGFVRAGNDRVAVVENAAKRTYFLREKDPVFNGEVVRITDNELIFRETVIDRVGRAIPHEVVKRLPKG